MSELRPNNQEITEDESADLPAEQVSQNEAVVLKQHLARGLSPVPEDRKEKLGEVFRNLVISRGEGDKKESVVFTPKQVERIISNEQILHVLPETFKSISADRFLQNVDNLGISLSDWKKVVLKSPSFFLRNPETINKKVTDTSEKLGLAKETYVRSALRQPTVLHQDPETVNKNIEEASEKLGVTKDFYINAALKHPTLFYQNPETINNHIEGISNELGLTKEQVVKAAAKNPSIFSYNPKTIAKNVEESSEKLGLTREKFIEVAMRKSSLFTNDPDTMGNNFKVLESLFKMTNEDIIKNPTFLTYAPEKNIAFYITEKITGKNMSFGNLTKNQLDFAKKQLAAEDYQKFELCYDYLDKLSRKMRKREKDSGESSKVYDEMINFTEKFFGKPGEPLDREQLKTFEKYIEKHI